MTDEEYQRIVAELKAKKASGRDYDDDDFERDHRHPLRRTLLVTTVVLLGHRAWKLSTAWPTPEPIACTEARARKLAQRIGLLQPQHVDHALLMRASAIYDVCQNSTRVDEFDRALAMIEGDVERIELGRIQ